MRIKALILLLTYNLALAKEDTLFILSDIADPDMSEQVVSIIQCIQTSRSANWELINKDSLNHRPLIHFFTKDQILAANLVDNKNISNPLGNDICSEALKVLKIPATPIQIAPPSVFAENNNQILEPKSEKSFLGKHWPYLAILGLVGSFFIIKNQMERESKPRTTTVAFH